MLANLAHIHSRPVMQRKGIRLGSSHRAWLFGALGGAFITGAAWWVLHNWFQVDGEFGPVPHPAEGWTIRLHGAAAMLSLILLGTLLTVHVKSAWLARRNRCSGALLLALNTLLALTGYLLYYAGGELMRKITSYTHLALGLILPLLLFLHIVFGRRNRPVREDAMLPGEEDESLG
jgi:hypothetical protein